MIDYASFGAFMAKQAAKSLKHKATNTIGQTASRRQVGKVTRQSKGQFAFRKSNDGTLQSDPTYARYTRNAK